MTTYYTMQIAQATGSETQSEVANGASGTLFRSTGTGTAAGWTTATYPSTGGTSGNFLYSDGTNFISAIPTVASMIGTSAAPTGTSSTAAYVMMGLGSTWKLTPKTYGVVRITISGQMKNATTADGINLIPAYGTSTAPINGASVTGTTVGINLIWTALTGLVTNGVPFCCDGIITGLSAGTAYWFDLQVKAVTGGTASVLNVTFTAQEIPS